MFDTLNYRQFFSLVIDNLDLKQKLRSMYEWFIFEDNNNNHHVTIDHHHKAESHHHYHHEWPSSITKQNLIEGVDDDVVVIFIIFFLFISMFVYYLFTRFDHFTTVTLNSLTSSSAATSSLLIDTTQQQQQSTQTILPNSSINNNNNNMFQRQRHFNSMDSNCPVCLNTFVLPVETNCGHLFCGQCIVVYWQQSQWRGGPIKCPVCRQQVNILLPCFQLNNINQNVNNNSMSNSNLNSTESTTTTTTNGDSSNEQHQSQNNVADMARQVTSQINSYNRRFSGEPRPWYDYLYDLPTMLRHLTNDFFSFNGLFYMFRLRVVICFFAAILYLISPLDMIPEAVFGIFGLFDDIVVVLLLAIYVTIIYRRFLSSRWGDD
ncbi:translation initiation factor eIF4E, variant 2 [Dermatophagoides farinae]|nr:E3 ubiquitin-protein ligase RNF170-like isoform X1 [Dermatophagoides farinae]KAH9517994.1 translation initiation factor eIF4E, variant 2 [Dermatophagoides farinae]